MKLRDHPRMTYRAVKNWPPVWLEKYANNETLRGEIGVLTHLAMRSTPSARCYLHITYKPDIGTLLLTTLRSVGLFMIC